MWPVKGLLVCTLLFSWTRAQCFTDNDDAKPYNPNMKYNLYTGQQNFTVSLLMAINKATPNENIFFSPLSTYNALLLAYFGAKSHTEESLKKGLRLGWSETKNDVIKAYQRDSVEKEHRYPPEVEFSSANKIFVSKETELRQCVQDTFKNELEALDFKSETEQSRKAINAWVASTTRDQIQDFLPHDSVTTETKLVLANAAYFKGQWEVKFDSNLTEKELFYTTPEKYDFVDMMYSKDRYSFAASEKLRAHILEIPYKGDHSASMIIFLTPFESNGIDIVLSRLNPETFKEAIDELFPQTVEVKLPRFSFEKEYNFVSVIKEMGMGEVFEENADFSGFSKTSEIKFDDAAHKAKIEVNEEGSTAAAATAIFQGRSGRLREPPLFFCNHPFLFFIYDRDARAVLFSGIYRGPNN